MNHAARLKATIELIEQVEENSMPADYCMAFYFKQRRYIGAKDKGVISEQFYTVLRHKLSFSYLIEKTAGKVSARLLVAVLLLSENQKVDLSIYFDGSEYGPHRLSKGEQAVLNEIEFTLLETAPDFIRLDVPEWLFARLKVSLAERLEDEMLQMKARACTDIRVNTLKSTFKQVSYFLKQRQLSVKPTAISPWGLRFDGRVALFGLDSFKQGWFEVQDEGSQLLAMLSGVKAGDKVVDFCAGAAGKSLAMAMMMQNKGVIYACDVNEKRLQAGTKRIKRAGVDNIRQQLLSSEKDKWVKHHRGKMDVVFIDAPCSGTGTWRRSPDSRWNLTEQGLLRLLETQQSILQSASRLVKQGGRLLYATCSLLKEENEQQIEQFLLQNLDFKRVRLPEYDYLLQHKAKLQLTESELRTFPKLSDMDGFFVCSLQRNNDLEVKMEGENEKDSATCVHNDGA